MSVALGRPGTADPTTAVAAALAADKRVSTLPLNANDPQWGIVGNGTTDDTNAIAAFFDAARAGAGTVVMGHPTAAKTYLVSKPLNVAGIKVVMIGQRGQTQIKAASSWSLSNGAHLLRNWKQTDYTGAETDYTKAPKNCPSPSYYVYMQSVWLNLNSVAGLNGVGLVHINETSAIRDFVAQGSNGGIGLDWQSNNDLFGVCVNGGYWENVQFYGSGWKHYGRAVGWPRAPFLQSGSGLAGITYTAKDRYTADNAITVEHVAGSGALSVAVVGGAITVTLASGGSTAAQVKAAVDANVQAAALVTTALTLAPGSSNMVAASAANLAGGGLDAARVFEYGFDLHLHTVLDGNPTSDSCWLFQNMANVVMEQHHSESYPDPALAANTDLAVIRLKNVKDFQEINGSQGVSVAIKHPRWYATKTASTPSNTGLQGGAAQVGGPIIQRFNQNYAFGHYDVPVLKDDVNGFSTSETLTAIYNYDGAEFRYRTTDGVEHQTLFAATQINGLVDPLAASRSSDLYTAHRLLIDNVVSLTSGTALGAAAYAVRSKTITRLRFCTGNVTPSNITSCALAICDATGAVLATTNDLAANVTAQNTVYSGTLNTPVVVTGGTKYFLVLGFTGTTLNVRVRTALLSTLLALAPQLSLSAASAFATGAFTGPLSLAGQTGNFPWIEEF